MIDLGTKNNPIQFNLHDVKKLDELCLFCEEMGWAYRPFNDLNQPEDLLELEYLMAKEVLNTKKTKLRRNAFCPCGSGKKLKKCCIDRVCQDCGDLHFDEIEFNHANP